MTSVSCRGPVNPSTQTFPNINLSEAIANFLVAWKITQNHSIFLHPNTFNMSWKLFSYLVSVSRRDPVNPSIPTFPNISLTKKWPIYLLFGKSLKKGCNNLYFHPFTFNMNYKSFSYLTPLSYRGPVIPSTLVFGNISQTKTMIDLIFD